jgi:hypothetical protein
LVVLSTLIVSAPGALSASSPRLAFENEIAATPVVPTLASLRQAAPRVVVNSTSPATSSA